jgi:hypothetical protein
MWTVVAKKHSGWTNRLISCVRAWTVSLPAELIVLEVVTTCPTWSSKLLKPSSVVLSETREAFGSRMARETPCVFRTMPSEVMPSSPHVSAITEPSEALPKWLKVCVTKLSLKTNASPVACGTTLTSELVRTRGAS